MAYINDPRSPDNEMWTSRSNDPLVRALRGGAMNRAVSRKPMPGNVGPQRPTLPARGPRPPMTGPMGPLPGRPMDPITTKPMPGGVAPGIGPATGKPMPAFPQPAPPMPTMPQKPAPMLGGVSQTMPFDPNGGMQTGGNGQMETGGVSQPMPFEPDRGMPMGAPNDAGLGPVPPMSARGLPPPPISQPGSSPLSGGPVSANVPFNPAGGMTAGQPLRPTGLGRLMPPRRY